MNVEITPTELAERLRSDLPPSLLDVRQPVEHALASLTGARLIPLNELPSRVHELDDWKGREVVALCHHGVRSLGAARFLLERGFQDVRSLAGGIERWSVEVDPKVPRYR